MKLTTKGRYAVMAMADLASYTNNKPISLTEISLRQNISLSYLEQLFLKLKKRLFFCMMSYFYCLVGGAVLSLAICKVRVLGFT